MSRHFLQCGANISSSHKDRIMAALAHGPLTAHGISKATGLTVVQVDRRAVGGFRVWEAVKGGE